MIDELVRTLVVAGSPEPSSAELVASTAASCDVVVAVDRGADALRRAGVVPTAFCGDADSISEEGLAWVRSRVPCERLYPSHKDDTDLALGMRLAEELAYQRGSYVATTVCCASGGRSDHALGVFGVLARFAADSPVLVDDGLECHVLSPEGTPAWAPGADACGMTFSVVPLFGEACVSERGFEWELDHRRMRAMDDLGISNV
ncbi:MAG: thiamine diphosphokinase, partial [Atopobiaceae bacterium]|nr:thiamine diphosphokinase [Atopobiaceae bacterium]